MDAAALELHHVAKRYPGAEAAAIGDLSFTVPAGEVCCLVGPSGCGKTTALRLVNRMVELTSGEIRIGGTSIADRPPAQLRREIGYAIQQIGLFPHRTVAQNIATVPVLLGWPKARIAARVDELLDLVGLERELGRRYPAQLSGGQRQRVGVARALAADPPLLLMDEPFGAIDPINRERLQGEFLRLQAEVGKTVLFVTHDIDEALRLADKVAVLRVGGELAQFASPAELLLAPADPFVEEFVGADRALKRLALLKVTDIALGEPRHPAPPVAVAGDASVRDALARLLAGGGHEIGVVDEDGRALGTLTADLIAEHLARDAAAAGAPAP